MDQKRTPRRALFNTDEHPYVKFFGGHDKISNAVSNMRRVISARRPVWPYLDISAEDDAADGVM